MIESSLGPVQQWRLGTLRYPISALVSRKPDSGVPDRLVSTLDVFSPASHPGTKKRNLFSIMQKSLRKQRQFESQAVPMIVMNDNKLLQTDSAGPMLALKQLETDLPVRTKSPYFWCMPVDLRNPSNPKPVKN